MNFSLSPQIVSLAILLLTLKLAFILIISFYLWMLVGPIYRNGNNSSLVSLSMVDSQDLTSLKCQVYKPKWLGCQAKEQRRDTRREWRGQRKGPAMKTRSKNNNISQLNLQNSFLNSLNGMGKKTKSNIFGKNFNTMSLCERKTHILLCIITNSWESYCPDNVSRISSQK